MRKSLTNIIPAIGLLSWLIIFSPGALHAADHQSDKDLIAARLEDSKPDKAGISFLQPASDRWMLRNNPVVLTFGGMMYVYQRFISPQLPSECLYHTSCSTFSKSLIGEYGLIRGMVATADRLMRCNRVAALDIHPLLIHQESGKVIEEVDIYKKQDK